MTTQHWSPEKERAAAIEALAATMHEDLRHGVEQTWEPGDTFAFSHRFGDESGPTTKPASSTRYNAYPIDAAMIEEAKAILAAWLAR